MSSRPSRPLGRALVALLVAVTASVVPMPAAVARTVPRTAYHEAPVTSGPVEPGFPVDSLGVVFDLPRDGGADVDPGHAHDAGQPHAATGGLAVRFRHGASWGPWTPLVEDGAQAAGQWSSALVNGADADAYQVRGLPAFARRARAAAINTTDGVPVPVAAEPAGAAAAVASCKSRADWGADESIRKGTRSFAPIQVLTVHHTATQNGDPDPDARVRAIYTYHVLTNGWDDIGYQALISEDGTVYEGRWSGSDSASCAGGGGTGDDFGHETGAASSDVVVGAHVGGYNTGNFGVALLGTLTTAEAAPGARAALVDYLAELAGRHGLDPEGTVAYDNGTNAATVDTVSGHRDFSATECPGGAMYADLPQVRADVAAALGGDPPPPPPPPDSTDDVATGETAVYGSVAGSYLATHAADGNAQAITEAPSNGKPSRRHARLEHVWSVDVAGGTRVELHVTATASGGDDDFAFSYSTDGGATYRHALTVPAGATGPVSADLDPAVAGPVMVRVADTNRADASTSQDSIAIDRLVIRSSGEAPPPPPPAELTLSAQGSKVKGAHHIDLVWADDAYAGPFDVKRDGAVVATVAGTSYTDVPGAKGAATYGHQVCRAGTATCSNVATTVF